MTFITETIVTHYMCYLQLYHCHQINSSAGRLLILEAIICPVVSVSTFY